MATLESFIKIGDGFSDPLSRFSSGLERSGRSMGKLKESLSRSVKPNLPNGEFDRFDGKIEHTTSLFKQMTGAGLAVNGISHIMGGLSNEISSMVDDLNDSSKAWQTFNGNMQMLGMNSKQITAARNDMQAYAQETIYSSSDMAQTFSQMASVGVKDAGALVKGFGGLAASATDPVQAMKTMSQQGTQMAAKPMVQWQDFKLMLDQAPAGIAAVAKTMHMSNQQLVQDVQNGKIKTEDFFNAVEKTGNNKQFTKMATTYKTVGQAMDGLKETAANKLQPAFDKLGSVGIDAISGIIDKIGDLNIDGAVDKIMPTFKNMVNGMKDGLSDLTKAVGKFFDGLGDSGVFNSIIDEASSLKNAVMNIINGLFGDAQDKMSGFQNLGNIIGGAFGGAAKAFSSIYDVISGLDPNLIKILAGAFFVLKASLKGFAIGGLILLFEWINKMQPGTVKTLASALVFLAGAIMLIVAAIKAYKGLQAVKGFITGIKTPKTPKTPTPPQAPAEEMNPERTFGNAGAWIKIGTALLIAGAGVIAIGIGMYIMATAAIKLSKAGGGAVAIFFGIIAAIALLAVAVAVGGSAMIEGSVGFVLFGLALLLVGAAVWLVSDGLAILAGQLPNIANYGLMAALNITLLGVALIVFGAGAIVAGAGLVVLAAGLIVLSLAMVIAAAACFVLGAGAVFLGVGLLLVGAGLFVIGLGLSAIANGVMDIYNTFQTIFGGITKGVSDTMGKVPGLISGFLNKAVGTIKNFNLLDAGKAIINGFVNGLKSAWETGKKFIGSITGYIKDHKGPIDYDRRLLIPHGNAIMTGFHEGLKNQFVNVKRSIHNMTNDIAGTSLSLPSSPGDLLADGFDRAKLSLYGLIHGMKDINGNNVIDVNGSGSIDSSALDDQIGYTSKTNTTNNANNNSRNIAIHQGAIQINSTGNEEYDGERLTQILENYLQGKAEGSLY